MLEKILNMEPDYSQYNTHLDVKFEYLQKMDINAMVQACEHKWFNQTLTKVNESVVRLGIVKGDYHWHKHDDDDEFFYVLQGQLLIDIEVSTIELNPNQGVTIPKGVMHRPHAPIKTVMLMIETLSIQPTGN